MIKTNVTARAVEVDDKLRSYIDDKLSALDRYLPRRMRESALLEVVLSDDPGGREDNRYVCEAVLDVQGTRMTSVEGTINLYASIDVVEAKLRAQLRTYKAKHVTEPRRGRMLTRLMGRVSETDPGVPAGELIE